MKMQCYKLKGSVMWCLNFRNGWIRVKDVMVRWNTDWTIGHTYFSVTAMR